MSDSSDRGVGKRLSKSYRVTKKRAHRAMKREDDKHKSQETKDIVEIVEALKWQVANLHSKAQIGRILVETALVGNMLDELIKYRMLNLSPKLEEKLFNSSMGALHSFSSKIDIAYAFAMIDHTEYRDLHGVRGVRNALAHTMNEKHFDSPEVVKCLRQISDYKNTLNKDEFFRVKVQRMQTSLLRRIYMSEEYLRMVNNIEGKVE